MWDISTLLTPLYDTFFDCVPNSDCVTERSLPHRHTAGRKHLKTKSANQSMGVFSPLPHITQIALRHAPPIRLTSDGHQTAWLNISVTSCASNDVTPCAFDVTQARRGVILRACRLACTFSGGASDVWHVMLVSSWCMRGNVYIGAVWRGGKGGWPRPP